MDIITELDAFMETVGETDRFAYWGLTSKIERPFRDNFAFYLNEKYRDRAIVAVEYTDARIKRADLVTLDLSGNPETVIEFKACYAFDLVDEEIGQWINKAAGDYHKHEDVHGVKKYFVLLAANPLALPGPKTAYGKAAAYYRGIGKFLEEYDPDLFYGTLPRRMKRALSLSETPLRLAQSWSRKTGRAFGVECGLFCFLFEEKSRGRGGRG